MYKHSCFFVLLENERHNQSYDILLQRSLESQAETTVFWQQGTLLEMDIIPHYTQLLMHSHFKVQSV